MYRCEVRVQSQAHGGYDKVANVSALFPNDAHHLISPPPINTHARRAALDERDPPMALDREFEITEPTLTPCEMLPPLKASRSWMSGPHCGRRQQIMYEELIKTIGKEYPEVHYDNLAPVFPAWTDIDWEHPEKSLYVSKERGRLL
ncbi:hypothetical protein BJ912DRAFT_1059501 [Pholiota molesta]|nr:hypothetical protein BJ912DRAFT_1059501 [Pholiota molesta]